MSYVNVNISGKDIILVNNVLLNNITVNIDLSAIWSTVIQYTNIYIGTDLGIPVLVNNESQEMYMTLSNTFIVKDIVGEKVEIQGQCPGIVDTSKQPTGKAKVIFYNIGKILNK